MVYLNLASWKKVKLTLARSSTNTHGSKVGTMIHRLFLGMRATHALGDNGFQHKTNILDQTGDIKMGIFFDRSVS